MNVRRTIWFGVASIAVATWLTASTAAPRPPALPPAPVEAARAAQVDRSAAALRLEVERLHDRFGPTATPTGRRDLFRFSQPSRRATAAAHEAKADTPLPVQAPLVAPRPPLTLIGMAEDESANGVVLTAIVSGFGDVFLVRPGDIIAGRYRVEALSPEAVHLIDPATSIQTTLALH